MQLSIVIPAYNCDKFINQTMSLVLELGEYDTFDEYEAIVVDDGSWDNTPNLVDSLAIDNNIIVVHQINSGVSNARNNGIDLINGKYFYCLDSDDSFDVINMHNCIKSLRDSDADMLIFGMSFDYFSRKKMYRSDEIYPSLSGIQNRNAWIENIDSLFLKNCLSSVCNKWIKYEIVRLYNLRFNESMFIYEDLDLTLRVLSKCDTIFFQPVVVYHYRQSNNGSLRYKNLPNIHDISRIIEKDLIGLGCDPDFIINQLNNILLSQKINSLTFYEILKQYPKNANGILRKRIRHIIAVFLKSNIGDFRKWKL